MSSNAHTPRAWIQKSRPELYERMARLNAYVHDSGLDHRLLELIKIRASQINGCAFCLDMHHRDARKAGVPDEQAFLIAAWREAPHHFTEAERAALELTEAVTRIGDGGVPDALYARVREHYSEEEYADLLGAIVVINGWNRFAIATGRVPARQGEAG